MVAVGVVAVVSSVVRTVVSVSVVSFVVVGGGVVGHSQADG